MSDFNKIWSDNILGRNDIDYKWQRTKEYPSMGDQLDMLWHAMDRGELTRVEPFYKEIRDVKLKYKPVTVINGTYGAVIAGGKVTYLIKWDKEEFPEYPHDGDGIVEITQEVVDYLGFVPLPGDQFVTTGNQYSVPPGSFISSNS
tara:strand:- start:177 stop:611 length:435 start_codon:yes stop_codon:yes gene_type:complete